MLVLDLRVSSFSISIFLSSISSDLSHELLRTLVQKVVLLDGAATMFGVHPGHHGHSTSPSISPHNPRSVPGHRGVGPHSDLHPACHSQASKLGATWVQDGPVVATCRSAAQQKPDRARQHGSWRHFSFRTKGALRGQYVAALEIGSNGEKLYSNDCHGACRMGFSH